MLDTESFKSVIVFQAWNALTAAQADADNRARIQAIQNECSRLAGVIDAREAELRAVRAERDEAMRKLAEIANAAARSMLSQAETAAPETPRPTLADGEGSGLPD